MGECHDETLFNRRERMAGRTNQQGRGRKPRGVVPPRGGLNRHHLMLAVGTLIVAVGLFLASIGPTFTGLWSRPAPIIPGRVNPQIEVLSRVPRVPRVPRVDTDTDAGADAGESCPVEDVGADEGEKDACRKIELLNQATPIDIEAIPGFSELFELVAPVPGNFGDGTALKGELVRSMETVNKLGEVGQFTAPFFLTVFKDKINADQAKLTLNSLGTRGRCVYVKELPSGYKGGHTTQASKRYIDVRSDQVVFNLDSCNKECIEIVEKHVNDGHQLLGYDEDDMNSLVFDQKLVEEEQESGVSVFRRFHGHVCSSEDCWRIAGQGAREVLLSVETGTQAGSKPWLDPPLFDIDLDVDTSVVEQIYWPGATKYAANAFDEMDRAYPSLMEALRKLDRNIAKRKFSTRAMLSWGMTFENTAINPSSGQFTRQRAASILGVSETELQARINSIEADIQNLYSHDSLPSKEERKQYLEELLQKEFDEEMFADNMIEEDFVAFVFEHIFDPKVIEGDLVLVKPMIYDNGFQGKIDWRDAIVKLADGYDTSSFTPADLDTGIDNIEKMSDELMSPGRGVEHVRIGLFDTCRVCYQLRRDLNLISHLELLGWKQFHEYGDAVFYFFRSVHSYLCFSSRISSNAPFEVTKTHASCPLLSQTAHSTRPSRACRTG